MNRKDKDDDQRRCRSGSSRGWRSVFQKTAEMCALLSFLLFFLFLRPAHSESCTPRAAALTGNPEAENLLGLAYIDGKKGCAQNSERGIRWLKKAAAAGSQNAVDNLCWAYGGGYMPDKKGNRVANPLLPVHPGKKSYWCGKSDIPE